MKIRNPDVPDSAIIKQLHIEIGKLKSEIAELEYKLQKKDETIAAFKKWQGRVARYKYMYWLSQGLQFMETPPPAEELHALVGVHCNYGNFEKHLKRAKSCYNAYLKNLNKLKSTQEEVTYNGVEDYEKSPYNQKAVEAVVEKIYQRADETLKNKEHD